MLTRTSKKSANGTLSASDGEDMRVFNSLSNNVIAVFNMYSLSTLQKKHVTSFHFIFKFFREGSPSARNLVFKGPSV